MASGPPPILGYALLGLIAQFPRSGYELRKALATYPLEHFSDSPGAVYPALHGLRKRGLVSAHTVKHGRRTSEVMRITPKGRIEFSCWLLGPVSRETVMWRMDELVLRFAFLGEHKGRAATVKFTRDFLREVTGHIQAIEHFLASPRAPLPGTGRLAVENGLEAYRAHARWARGALKTLTTNQRRTAS